MYCQKCGNKLSKTALFCSHCGTPIGDKIKPDEFRDDENIDPLNDEETALDLNTSGDISERKSIKLKPILLISSGVLLVLVLLGGLLIPGFRYFMERTFLPPKVLLANAYSRGIETVFTSHLPISEISGDMATEYEAKLTVGQSSLSVLSMVMGVDPEDISALSDITVTCDANRYGNLLKTDYDLSFRNTSVLTAEQYVDRSSGDLWLVLPELNKKPLYVSMNDSVDPAVSMDQTVLSVLQSDPKVMKKITLRYMEMLLGVFESIEKDSKAVKLNGLTERMTVLEAYTNEVELYNTLIDMLEEMLTDEELHSIMDSDTNPNEVAQFKADVQQMIDQLKDSSVELDVDHSYTLYTYLNNRNQIVGIRVEYASDEGVHDIFSCLTVSMGDDFAAEYSLFEDIIINGKGTIGEKVTGSYKVFVSGAEMCQLELTDLGFSADGLVGTLRVIPDQNIIDAMLFQSNMDPGISMFSSMLDLSIVININYRPDHAFVNASVQSGSADVLGISLKSTQKEAHEIQLPAEYVSVKDESGVEQWISGMDLFAIVNLMDRLKQAGFSADLLPAMTELFSNSLVTEPEVSNE